MYRTSARTARTFTTVFALAALLHACGPAVNPNDVIFGTWSPDDELEYVEPGGTGDGQTPGNPTASPRDGVLYVSSTLLEFSPVVDLRTLILRNEGSGTLRYTIEADVPWAVVTPSEGTNDGHNEIVHVTLNRAVLPAGYQTGTLTVRADNGEQHEVRLQVTDRVDGTPVLAAGAEAVHFTNADETHSLTLTNVGGGSFVFHAAESAAWLAVTPESGGVDAEPITLTLSVDRTALPLGTHETLVEVSADTGETVYVVVTLEHALHVWIRMSPWDWDRYYRPNILQAVQRPPLTGLTMWLYMAIGNKLGELRNDGTDGNWADPAFVRQAIADARALGYQSRPGLTRILSRMSCLRNVRDCRWEEATRTLWAPDGVAFRDVVPSGDGTMLTVFEGTGAVPDNYTIVEHGDAYVRLDRSLGAAADGRRDIRARYVVPSDLYYGHGLAHLQYYDRERWEGAARRVLDLLPALGPERAIEIDLEPYWEEGTGVGMGIRYPEDHETELKAAMQPLLDVLRDNDVTVYCWPGVTFTVNRIFGDELDRVVDIDERMYYIYDFPHNLNHLVERRGLVEGAGRMYVPAVTVPVLKHANVHYLQRLYDDFGEREIMIYIDGGYWDKPRLFTDAWYTSPASP